MILAALAMFPTALTAFTLTCDVAVERGHSIGFGPDLFGFLVSLAAGLEVLGAFVLFMIALRKYEVRRPPD